MALGLTTENTAPITTGAAAKTDPILSYASLLASDVLLKMASVPKAQRPQKMVAVLDGMRPGMGKQARAEFLRLMSTKTADQADQAMFDAVRVVLANHLVTWTKNKMARQGMSGLGTTQQDVQSSFCAFAGGASIFGGVVDAFNLGGQSGQTGAVQSGAATGGTIAGCNVAGIDAQTRNAEANARVAQSTTAQQMLALQAQEDRQFRYLLLGGGGLVVATILFAVLRK